MCLWHTACSLDNGCNESHGQAPSDHQAHVLRLWNNFFGEMVIFASIGRWLCAGTHLHQGSTGSGTHRNEGVWKVPAPEMMRVAHESGIKYKLYMPQLPTALHARVLKQTCQTAWAPVPIPVSMSQPATALWVQLTWHARGLQVWQDPGQRCMCGGSGQSADPVSTLSFEQS